jgi:hypothetical protein
MEIGRLSTLLVVAVAVVCSPSFGQEREPVNGVDKEWIEHLFASPAFAAVRQAERVEALPVQGAGISAPYRVLERPVPLDPKAMRDVGTTVLSTKSYLGRFGGVTACLFQPSLALRFHKGHDSVQVLVCFFCDELAFEEPGGRPLGDGDTVTFGKHARTHLLAVAKKAFPADPMFRTPR